MLEVSSSGIDLKGDFDPMYMGLGLDAFVAWRAEAAIAGRPARLHCGISEGLFEVRWEEGPLPKSSPPPDRKFGLEDEARPDRPVDSLALPLLARIVSAHGGYVETSTEPTVMMTLRWPRFKAREQES
jgi:hypothetical protein